MALDVLIEEMNLCWLLLRDNTIKSPYLEQTEDVLQRHFVRVETYELEIP